MSTARERHLLYYLERIESGTLTPSQIDVFYPQVENLWIHCQDSVARIRLLNGFVDYFEKRSLPDVQVSWYLQTLNDAIDAEDFTKQAIILNNIGRAVSASGQWLSARRFLLRTLHLARQHNSQTTIANILGNIAETHAQPGNFAGSMTCYFEEALTIYRSFNATPEIATVLHNVGSAYSVQGDYARALAYLQQALEIRSTLDHNAEIAGTLHQISQVYAKQGDWSQALQHAERAAESLEENGELSSSNIKTWYALGVLYGKLGRWELAASVLNKALPWSHLRDHETHGRILASLGAIYANSQNWPEALQVLEKAIEVKEELEDEAGVAKAHSDMASVYYQLGDVNQAIDHYLYAYRLFLQVENSEDAAFSLQNIGVIYSEIGDWESAQLALEAAVPLYKQAKSDKLPHARSILTDMIAHASQPQHNM